LGRSLSLIDSRPFIIGMFLGRGKPQPISELLADFNHNIDELQIRGLNINGDHFNFELDKFICDAPARAYLKCCKGHPSIHGCEKCEQEGFHNSVQVVFTT